MEPEPSAEKQIAEAYGDYLARELRARNWTIRALAARSGVDHTTISRLIHGRHVPTLRTASRLNEALEGPDPEPVPTIAMNLVLNDPVQRVAMALGGDPSLSARARGAILRYYVGVRSAGREEPSDAPRGMTGPGSPSVRDETDADRPDRVGTDDD